MGISTKIIDLKDWDSHSQPEQLAAFTRTMVGRNEYALSHVHFYLRVTPEGELHKLLLSTTENPDTHALLNNKRRTQLWAKLPPECVPSAALKSQGRLKSLLAQLHNAHIRGHTGRLDLRWSSKARPTFRELLEDLQRLPYTPAVAAAHSALASQRLTVPLSA